MSAVFGALYDLSHLFKNMPPLMDAKAVASVLDISPKTVFGWVENGKIPYIRINGILRFDRAQIIAWLQEGNWPGKRHAGKVN